MKEKFYGLLLFVIELIFFYIFSYFLDISIHIINRIVLIWVILLLIFKHYKIESTLVWDEIRSDAKAFIYFCALSLVFLYPDLEFFIKIICLGFFQFMSSVLTNRMLRIILRKWIARRTIIIGTGNHAYRVGTISNNNRFALTNVIGFVRVNDDLQAEELNKNDKFVVYDYEQLDNLLINEKIDQVIIAIPNATKEYIENIYKQIYGKVDKVKILPELNFTMTFNSKINDYDGELLISTSRGKIGLIQRLIKRIIDILAGIVGCFILIPLTFYVSHKNKQSGDENPIFFKQERIGLKGKPIYIYKYRSMVPNAEKILDKLMESDPKIKDEYLKNKKLIDDPRITEIGHFLRKTSLDEFPQFINVLKGEMSLVGPRPYLPREKKDMDIYYDSVIACKPGITGMWQANGRSDVGFTERCQLDDYYYRNWTLGLDLVIIYKTIKSVIYGKGAL